MGKPIDSNIADVVCLFWKENFQSFMVSKGFFLIKNSPNERKIGGHLYEKIRLHSLWLCS